MALKKAKDESMASVVEQIEQENIRQLNDSVVDEDGIVRDEPLLAGIEYEGEHLRTFSYRARKDNCLGVLCPFHDLRHISVEFCFSDKKLRF